MTTSRPRPAWAEIWMGMALNVSVRSTCPRGYVGAVLVSPDQRVLGTGYNGSPRGLPHCEDAGCLLIAGHCTRTIHAELNAILNAKGDLSGSTLYITMYP